MTHAMISGSFDPITLGHVDIISRTSELFDKVSVVVFVNSEKTYRFSAEERLAFIKKAVSPFPNVSVDFSDGYAADYAKEHGVNLIIRGVRNEEDFSYETKMAEYNRNRSGVETLLMPASPAFHAVSSTSVREALDAGKDVANLLPKEILPLISPK